MFGLDKNCVLILFRKYVGEEDMLIIIFLESEMKLFFFDVIVCIYYCYVILF